MEGAFYAVLSCAAEDAGGNGNLMGAAGGRFIFPEPLQVRQRKGVAFKFKVKPGSVNGLEIKILIHMPDFQSDHFSGHDG